VTLLCFGASLSLVDRFKRSATNSTWEIALKNPYNLFVIVFNEIFKEMDQQAWNLGAVFRGIEHVGCNIALVVSTVSHWLTREENPLESAVEKRSLFPIRLCRTT
jgi:hypothetical protein